MLRRTIPYTLLPIAILFFTGCSKSSTKEDDNILPIITIATPTPGQVFNSGQMISITGELTDNQKLAEIHIHISNNSTGALLIDIHRYPGTASYSLNETFIADPGIQYKIQVIAKDNSANENRATVEVSSN